MPCLDYASDSADSSFTSAAVCNTSNSPALMTLGRLEPNCNTLFVTINKLSIRKPTGVSGVAVDI